VASEKHILRLLFILFISFYSSTGFSQQKSNYSLLWRISGNGLSKPSYLFGTMHVKDKRVFNFSDSVMLCLQKCSRFALEVHPDTIMSKMFQLLENNDSLRSIDKLLSKEQYNKLAKKFQDKNGYAMGKTNPVLLESLMEPNDDKPDDKVSFIDAYLYGIARTLNKNIFGLEEASTQINEYFGSTDVVKERLLDLLDDSMGSGKDESKEEMIKIYSTGDLEAIYKYIEETGTLDSVIIGRNKVMASSMIRYMTNESLFTAVGAAHLPGPDGVIAILKKAGYNVSPVKSAFTGVANTYHIDYMKMDWPEHIDEHLGYSINFPGVPIKNKLNGTENIIYPDMANDIYYGLYAIPKGTLEQPANRKDVIDKTISLLNKNKKNSIIGKKDFVFKGAQCTELLIRSKTGYLRVRLILANNLLYYFYVGSKHNHLSQSYVDRFFNSFVYYPIPQKAAESWITYTNTIGAFSVKLPGQPKLISREVPSKIHGKDISFTLNMYLSTDTTSSKSYLVRYNDYPAGTFLGNKDAVLNSMINDFKGKGKIVSGPNKIMIGECDGWEVKAILTGGYHADIKLFVRGNRIYMLLKEIIQSDLKDDNKKDPFFDSFQLLPYAEPDYYNLQPDSGNFKLQMVSKPLIKPDTSLSYIRYLNHTVMYFSTNPNSGGFYDFQHSKISPYYRIENEDSLYSKITKEIVGYEDSLLKVDTVLIDGIKGRELLTIKKGTSIRRRSRILIEGNNFFCLTGRVENAELFDKSGNAFYGSFKITHPSQKADFASSKAEKIYHDLGSADTLTYTGALGALSFYKFEPAELPYVYAALKRSYPDDTSTTGTRHKLINGLKTVNNDSTINVLSDLYATLHGKDDLKGAILNTVPFINRKTGFDIYLKLFVTDPPLKVKEAYKVFTPVSDSVEFAAEHFEQLLPFIKHKNYRDYVLRAANNIASQKNDSYDKTIKTDYLKIMAFANDDIDDYLSKKDSDKYGYSLSMYNYMQLMGKIKSQDFNDKLTKKYIEKDPKGVYIPEAVIARINNNLPNNQSLVIKLLDSLGTRYDLMKAYNDQKQLDKVPLKYQKPDEFAKLCLYQYISEDEYGNPEKIKLLGSIIKNGSVYYVFKYSLPDREDEKELIGIVGPYKVGAIKLNFKKYNAYTGYEALQTNWRLQASKMIKPLLELDKTNVVNP